MVDWSEDMFDIEKLYEYGERLNEAKDKSQNVKDYEVIIRAAKGSIKAKQLAAQLIPRFFKFFPSLSNPALEAHFDLCEEEELGLPKESKLDLLKNLTESSPYTSPQDSRQLLPSVVQLLKKYMSRIKAGEETNFTYVECLLYTFLHLAYKTPNATNSLCGYKIVTDLPSDRLGEDFLEYYTDFTERLSNVEDLARASMMKLTQGMAEHGKAMAAAKTDEAKTSIKMIKQNTTTGLRTCSNILAMTAIAFKITFIYWG